MSDNYRGTFGRPTPEERYYNDNTFHCVVDMLENLIRQCELAPSEVREAAMLATVHHELRSTIWHVVPMTRDQIEEWQRAMADADRPR